MPKQVWTVAAILTVLVVLGVMSLAHWHRGLELAAARAEASQAGAELERSRAAAVTHESQAAELAQALAATRTRLDELQRQNQQATQAQQSLEAEMRRALESKDVTISELQGKLTVDIVDRVLFDSGEAQLRPEGQEVLRKVAGVLAPHPNRRLHVIGPTDNVPIRASARSRYPSNWELSTARALAAVRFLSEQAGVDPRRLGAVGYGEFRPLADNATPEGRAKNRRIAVVVLSDELVGSDAAPLPTAPVPGTPATNAAPPTATGDLPAAPAKASPP